MNHHSRQRAAHWGIHLVAGLGSQKTSRLGLAMGVFSEAMRNLSLLASLFFVASIAFGDDKQIITMEDGTKLTLLGTTFGSHHMAPGYENLSTANWVNTAPNTTVVWIEEKPESSKQPIELLVSDRANTGCVIIETGYRSFCKIRRVTSQLRIECVSTLGQGNDFACPTVS